MNFIVQIDWRKIMRITFSQLVIAILFTCVSYAKDGLAQHVLDRQVDISVRKVSLTEVLSQLEAKTRIKFVYSENVVSTEGLVSIKAKHASLKTVLDELLHSKGIAYDVINDRIVLGKMKNHSSPPGKVKKDLVIDLRRPLQTTITGKVTDAVSGNPIPGVAVTIKGTTRGTATDLEGNYSLAASPEETLVFSFLGYKNVERAPGNETVLNVALESDVAGLEQVVVVGYGTQQKKDLTGAVSVVNVQDLVQQPTANVTTQLQGRAAGVTVLGGGQPGDPPQIRIRGINTFGNNSPLFVVDGVPTENINDLNPYDIATMQVMKDAGSASIYGSRAANGVVIISTKRGHGKVKVSYDAYYGTQLPPSGNVWDILSPMEMAELKWMADPANIGNDVQYGNGSTPRLPDYIQPDGAMEGEVDIEDYNVDPFYTNSDAVGGFYRIVKANKQGTNWFDEIFDPAPMTSHNLSVSGGGEQGNYLFSMNYFNQEGTLINTYMKRYTIRANSQYNVSSNIRIGENISFSVIDNPRIAELTEGSGIGHAYRQQPIIPVHDIMGNYAGSAGTELGNARNPVAILERTANNKANAYRIFGNIFAEADFAEHFTVRTQFGGELYSGFAQSFAYPEYENKENTPTNTYNESSYNGNNWTWTNMITYHQVFNDMHDLTVLAGTEAYHNQGRNLSGSTQGYFSFDPDFTNLGSGSGTRNNASGRYEDALFSLFGRVDYTFKDRYLLSATVRRDGSSRFQVYQYGWFPAVSAGWRISEEEFWNSPWLDELKLRGSYGVMGNQMNVAPDNAFTTFSGDRTTSYYDIGGSNNSITEGFRRNRVGNPDAKWEKNITANIGLDATLFSGKLDLTAEYYRKDVDDLLYNPSLPGTAGSVTAPFINIAKMRNQGLDLSATTYLDITKDLLLDATVTFTTYSNEILKVSAGADYFDTDGRRFNGSFIVRNQVGSPIGSFFGYQIEGFWNTEEDIAAANAGSPTGTYQTDIGLGRFRYADINGDGMVTADDRTVLGNPNPDFSYGLNLGLKYKQFDFSFFLFGTAGNDIWNQLKWWHDFNASFQGAKSHTALYDSWTKEDHNAIAPIQEKDGYVSTNGVPNSYYVEKGSYLRAKNAQLGYTFPSETLDRMGISRLRIYLQAANLFTISDYSGVDPEISGGTVSFGIDEGAYPNMQQFLLGLGLTF
ncbi:TonB-linked SusC/RagA family outer membrane protein [Anseongella ginsenosidimutans]|uniref:TonB-linked SusC/RagA family outer membrane protein n=2 Tax=Anseongella ginsenosidimutans TaxID=496056 RepID=A0A4R3KMA6_9SPHI|nr:TonB-dependent receptor [Anseongella ginsenosidimutans]TCS84910.1 TonB-linked SusC/RagA family outer membrane protein [Anseongella ginsenosidimutans]